MFKDKIGRTLSFILQNWIIHVYEWARQFYYSEEDQNE